MAPRERRNAVYMTVLASLIWGTSFPGVKWGLGYVGNDILFLWLRFVIASAITLSVVLYLRRFSFSVLRNPVIWLIGAFNAGSFVAQYVGLNYTTASKTALLVDINVIAVAIVSYFAFRERLGRMQTLGIVGGMAGIVLLTVDGGFSFTSSQFMGDAFVYLAGWGWAFFIVLNKKMLDKHSAVEISSAAIVTSTIWLTIPVCYLSLTGADLSVQPMAWVSVVYLGLFCTSMATLFWAMGLEGVSATASATIMLIEVVTALLISMILLGETLTNTAIVGAAFVLAAIYLVSAGESPEERPSVSHT